MSSDGGVDAGNSDVSQLSDGERLQSVDGQGVVLDLLFHPIHLDHDGIAAWLDSSNVNLKLVLFVIIPGCLPNKHSILVEVYVPLGLVAGLGLVHPWVVGLDSDPHVLGLVNIVGNCELEESLDAGVILNSGGREVVGWLVVANDK